MTLGELIKALEAAPQDAVCEAGFSDPHSFRGFYEQLAFGRRDNTKVSDMLADAM